MKDTELAIKEILEFDLTQESDKSMFEKKESLRQLVDKNRPLSELQDILRLAVRSNVLELVKVLVEEKEVIPDTDTLHYALENTEVSAEFSKIDQEYSVEILEYLMRQTKYMKADIDSSKEEIDLQEKQEDFIQALSESRYICISDNIWNKDKQSIELMDDWPLEMRVIKAIKSCQGFLAVTDESTLTLYEIVKNRLIASAYLEKYFEITKAKKRDDCGGLFFDSEGELSSIKLTIIQFSDFCIYRKVYPEILVDRILDQQIVNATAVQALLGCRDENGQVMLGDKAKNKKWCIDFYMAVLSTKVEDVANLLGVSLANIIFDSKTYNEYRGHNEGSSNYSLDPQRKIYLVIAIRLKEQLSLEKTASAEVDKKEEAGALLKPDSTPSVSSFAKTKSYNI